MPGLLDFLKEPEGQGLLSAAFGGLASARRGAPINSVGLAGLAGLQGYTQAQDRELAQTQKGVQQQYLQSQIAENNAQTAQRLTAANLQKSKQDALPKLFGGQTTGGLLSTPEIGGVPMFSQGTTMTPKVTTGAGQLDYVTALKAGYSPEEISKLAVLPNINRPKVARTIKGIGPSGYEEEIQYDDYGQPVGTGVKQYQNPNVPFERDATGKIISNTPYQNYEFGKATAGAARTSNTVSIAGPENKYNADVGAGLAKQNLTLVESAKAAPSAIANAQRVRAALDAGAITGTGANVRLGVQKALETAGLVGQGKAASTEALMSGLATSTMDSIATSGLGSGQGFTDKDREFLASAKSGTIEMTPANLRRAADLNERAARLSYQKGQAVLGRWQKDPALRAVSQDTVLDEIPAEAPAKKTLSPAAPKAPPPPLRGTVRNGFKFQGGDPSDKANWVKQ